MCTMSPVAVTFLLWLAGNSYLWPMAQQAERDSGVTMENGILLSKTNVSLRHAMSSTTQWINNQTTPKPGGNKEKLILKRVVKRRKSHQKGLQDVSSHRCGDMCCPGWSMAPKTGTCTRAICTPKCKNRGVCRKPQKCLCKIGFEGSHCERRASPLITGTTPLSGLTISTHPPVSIRKEAAAISGDLSFVTLSPISFNSSLPTTLMPSTNTSSVPTITTLKSGNDQIFNYSPKNSTSLNWQPLTVQELQSILQRKGFAKKDKMATLLTKHLETQKSQTAKESWKEKHRMPNSIRTARGEYNILRQIQTNASGQVEKVRVMFTPMICRVHCVGDRCTNQCEKGNMTTVYSDDISRNNGEHGFRAFLCPLQCQNGGICIKKDKCLCPPNFTGKFCQIPVSTREGVAAYTIRNSNVEQNQRTKTVHTLPLSNHQPEKDGGAAIVNVHVEHPPEASVNIHQVERVDRRDGPTNADYRDVSRRQENRVPVHRVQAQSSPRINGYTETSGYGYCFRRLENGQV